MSRVECVPVTAARQRMYERRVYKALKTLIKALEDSQTFADLGSHAYIAMRVMDLAEEKYQQRMKNE